jgi:hypothetical protein
VGEWAGGGGGGGGVLSDGLLVGGPGLELVVAWARTARRMAPGSRVVVGVVAVVEMVVEVMHALRCSR